MTVRDETSLLTSRRWALAAAAAMAFVAAPATFAQVESGDADVVAVLDDPMTDAEGMDDGDEGGFFGGGGVAFTSEYIFRGIDQGAANDDGFFNGGLIIQPYLELGLPVLVVEEEGLSVSTFVGIWNSFGSEFVNDDGAGPTAWYESDLYTGFGISAAGFDVTLIYTFYTSPNDSFATVEEIGASVEYTVSTVSGEDEDAIGVDVGLGAGIFFETNNTAFGPDEGIYLELGATPSTEIEVDGFGEPITISIPVVAGFSVDDYYVDMAGDNEFFGYFSIAAAAGIPLPFPSQYGSWSLTPSVQAVFLGSDGLEAANGGDSESFIGALSVDFEF
ncbi:MAG: hypothetical protein AAGI46_14300 [Planctomycetota bacterium]